MKMNTNTILKDMFYELKDKAEKASKEIEDFSDAVSKMTPTTTESLKDALSVKFNDNKTILNKAIEAVEEYEQFGICDFEDFKEVTGFELLEVEV